MSQTILTMTDITREALRVLHQNLTFIGLIDRQYSDMYAVAGAKRGASILIRKPSQFAVCEGGVSTYLSPLLN